VRNLRKDSQRISVRVSGKSCVRFFRVVAKSTRGGEKSTGRGGSFFRKNEGGILKKFKKLSGFFKN